MNLVDRVGSVLRPEGGLKISVSRGVVSVKKSTSPTPKPRLTMSDPLAS
jgi:hypothetical protein